MNKTIIIEGETGFDIEAYKVDALSGFYLEQGEDMIAMNKQQATQLIEVLTKWVNGEEVE